MPWITQHVSQTLPEAGCVLAASFWALFEHSHALSVSLNYQSNHMSKLACPVCLDLSLLCLFDLCVVNLRASVLAQPPLEGIGWLLSCWIALITRIIGFFQGPFSFFHAIWICDCLSFLYFFNGNFQHADVSTVQSENVILILEVAVFVLLLLVIYSALLEHFPSVCFTLHCHFTGRETEEKANTASCTRKQCHSWNTIEDLSVVQWPIQKALPLFGL